MYLIQAERKINEYTKKINKNELEIETKESEIEIMHAEIDKKKKEIFNNFGYIDDQSLSMEDTVKNMEDKNNTLKSLIADVKILNNLKQKLKFILQRKSEKCMEYTISSQNVFVKLYDTILKAGKVNENELNHKADSLLQEKNVIDIKSKYIKKLTVLKTKLDILNEKEVELTNKIRDYKFNEKLEHVFKNDPYFHVENNKK